MKMTTRLMAIVLALLTASTVMAQADPSDEIKSAVRSMFREIAQGDFEAALGERIMIGASGFLREGLLREAPDAETLAMVVAQYRAAYEEGTRIQVLPSHINVMGNDRGALRHFCWKDPSRKMARQRPFWIVFLNCGLRSMAIGSSRTSTTRG